MWMSKKFQYVLLNTIDRFTRALWLIQQRSEAGVRTS